MPKRRTRPKPLIVDGEPYLYWIRELRYDSNGAVPLRVVVRADFGTRSFCTINGLSNREYWHDYPDWNPAACISLTPGVVCQLIRYTRTQGWEPTESRTNVVFSLDNSAIDPMHSSDGG